jgi:hypothetical protein
VSARRCILHAAIAVLAVAPLAHVGPAAGATSGGAVTGQGSGVLLLPPFTGDRVVLVLEAPGRFDITHLDKAGDEFAHLTGTIDCVEVHGTTAFVSGVVDGGFAPELAGDPAGQHFAITVADHGVRDLIGVAPPSRVAVPCSPVPLDTVIDEGGFTVRAR